MCWSCSNVCSSHEWFRIPLVSIGRGSHVRGLETRKVVNQHKISISGEMSAFNTSMNELSVDWRMEKSAEGECGTEVG